MLEVDKSTPLYKQLYLDLRASLQGGKYAPGDPLPTQRELEGQYGVSRATVRKAQGLLEKDGYIRVEQGKGAFVIKTFATPEAPIDFSLADNKLRKSRATTSRLLSKELIAADLEIAQLFQITPQTEMIRIQFLWLSNETPIALATSYLSPKFNFIYPADLSYRGILDVLQRDLGVVIAQQRKIAQACLATPAQLAALDLTPPAALLCASRTSYNQAGEIVEHTTTALLGHKIRLNLSAGEYELHGVST
jgi:GntR family transcriptional regulator